MPPKISEQVYIQRIKSAGNDRFEFLGWEDCFTNSRSKAVVKCLIDDHVWSATVSSLLTGRGCPVCKRRRYHPDERIEQLKLLGKDRYEFVSWVDKTFGSAVLKCIHDGHVWSNSLHTIIGKNIGCPVCSKSYRRTETESIDAINTAGYSKFKFVRWVDGYKTMKSKVVLRCEVDGHEWTSTINNIVNLGNGCPKCKHYGFKKLSPATFYLYKWTHPHTGDYFFKYGITNRSVDTRIEEQSRSTEYEPSAVEVLHFGHGADAKMIEESYKDRYPTPGISKDLFGDGYTETFREN